MADTVRTGATLQDITGQESGVIVWDGGEVWVGNWSSVKGLPRTLGPMDSVGLGEDLVAVMVPELEPDTEGAALRAAGEQDEAPQMVSAYRINNEAIAVTFEGWA